MWLVSHSSPSLHAHVSPLPDVCGLGFVSLSNANVTHLEMELGRRGPENSPPSSYGSRCFTLSFLSFIFNLGNGILVLQSICRVIS